MPLSLAPRDEDVQCRLVSDWFGYLVQVALGVLALGVLLWKREKERPRRTLLSFARDASKQGIGAALAHALNLALAVYLNGIGNECKWYFINFVADTALGVVLNLLLLRAAEAVLGRCTTRLQSGRYGARSGHLNFALQLALWLAVVVVVKLAIFFGVIVPFTDDLYDVGDVFLRPLDGAPRLELVVVMIIVPAVLNVGAFWVQDSYLMYSPTLRDRGYERAADDDGSDEDAADFEADFEREDSLWHRGRRTDPDRFGI